MYDRQFGGWREEDRFPLPPSKPRHDPSKPDDLRALGWAVAVHNDYKLDGVPHTFWLFTKGRRCVKGEGLTDADALNAIRSQLKRQP